MTLYIKHRPDNLDELFGNKATIRSLNSLLDKDNPPHVYLLHGPSGTGKTTIARIIAREFGCEEHEIHEKNNADFRGIDSSRAIIANSRFKGMQCYIFDEAHQLTKDAQDALLKIFEDTPDNCFYILCTTEPKKIKKTIRTRCVDLEMQPLNNQDMECLLNIICEKEDKLHLSADVIDHIIMNAEGGSRQALMMLEQIIDLDKEDQIKALAEYKSLEANTYKLCQSLAKTDFKTCVAMALELTETPEGIRYAILGYYATALARSNSYKFRHIIECFSKNYYDTNKAGLIASIFDVFDTDGDFVDD